jgi:hypothetical protein
VLLPGMIPVTPHPIGRKISKASPKFETEHEVPQRACRSRNRTRIPNRPRQRRRRRIRFRLRTGARLSSYTYTTSPRRLSSPSGGSSCDFFGLIRFSRARYLITAKICPRQGSFRTAWAANRLGARCSSLFLLPCHWRKAENAGGLGAAPPVLGPLSPRKYAKTG